MPTLDLSRPIDSESENSVQKNTNVPLALVNGLLIDGTGANPVSNAVVLVRDGKIQSVGRPPQVSIPPEYPMLDVQGAAILPGLINAHIHGAYDIQRLMTWAQAGVTTVREMGLPTPGLSLSERYQLRDRSRNDPQIARIVAASLNFSGPGGYGQVYVNSPADARTQALSAIDAGAEIIKFSFEDYRPLFTFWPRLPLPDAKALVNAAHERGVRAAVHISWSRNARRALECGADEIEHVPSDRLPDALIQRAVQANVLWIPTLELYQVVGKAMFGKLPGSRAPQFFSKTAINNLRRLVAAGVTIALGTDFDGFPGEFQSGLPMLEMELMQQAGMTPMQILVAATRNAAFACGKSQELGTIEAGKCADLLVVNGNPLEDLHDLQQVRCVIKNGVIIRGSKA